MTIETAFGRKTVVRRFGRQGWYVETLSTPNEPHGAFWVLHPSRGWIDVPRTSRALQTALTDGT